MLAEQVIDFTRGDISSWLIWVLFPVLLMMTVRKKHALNGSGSVLRAIVIRVVIGLVLSALLSGFFVLWWRLGPQYFTKLRLGEQSVVLKFNRRSTVTEIPVREIMKVSVVEDGTLRHPCSRVRIRALSGVFRSFRFNRLDDDQQAVLDALRKRVASNSVPTLR